MLLPFESQDSRQQTAPTTHSRQQHLRSTRQRPPIQMKMLLPWSSTITVSGHATRSTAGTSMKVLLRKHRL